MHESGYDLNKLLYLQQLALLEADAAPDNASRFMHLRIARGYEDEISRRTDGRVNFGRKPVRVFEERSVPAMVPLALVPA
jgi:hypothetical protein